MPQLDATNTPLGPVAMPIAHSQLRGKLLAHQPINITRCGLSQAQFAQDYRTHQWYQLTEAEPIIGTPTEFDFYRSVEGQYLDRVKKKTVATV